MVQVNIDTGKVWVERQVIGDYADGVFTQRIGPRSIYQQLNAKGIDVSLFKHLKLIGCHTWRLIHRQTHQILAISLDKVSVVGEVQDTGSGQQILVRLADFNEERAALQARLI